MVLLTPAFAPTWALFIGIVLILIADILFREKAKEYIVIISTLTLVASAALAIRAFDANIDGGSLFRFEEFYLAFSLFGLISSIIVVIASWNDLEIELDLGVFYSLLLLANIGGLLIASSQNLIPLYLGYELVSIPTYAMVAFRKKNRNAAEAGMKVFLLGALSSALIIYGLALFYGATGSFEFGSGVLAGADTLGIASIALIAAGCSFKIGLVPFHFWIPDVYVGAPTSVVTFLAASSKKMAFAFVFQIFFFAMPSLNSTSVLIFSILAAASMIFGNIAAVIQDKVMRILAYSTVAQAGYIAVAIVAYGAGDFETKRTAITGILFHVSAHILMKGTALLVVLVIIKNFANDHINNFRGLYHTSPILSSTMAIALFSLMGIPPLAGFFGKYFLFLSAVQADYTWLTIIGIIGSAISIYYYGRILRIMADKPDQESQNIDIHPAVYVMIILMTLLTVIFGVFGETIISTFRDGIIL